MTFTPLILKMRSVSSANCAVRLASLRALGTLQLSLALAVLSIASTAIARDTVVDATARLPAFSEVVIDTVGEVRLVPGSSFSYSLQAAPQVVKALKFKVTKNVLHIAAENSFQTDAPVRMTITLPQLDRADLSGSANVDSGVPTGRKFILSVSGAGNYVGREANCDSAVVDVSGSGEARLVGRCVELQLKLSGAGDAKLRQFRVDTATVTNSGSGDSELTVAKTLNARIGGSGDITYAGNPRVIQAVSGSGAISRSSM